jgi:hypothetical protein
VVVGVVLRHLTLKPPALLRRLLLRLHRRPRLLHHPLPHP